MKTTNRAPKNLEDILDTLGVKVVDQRGDELWARCPGHKQRLGREDKKPSWSINQVTGDHNCFSCQFSGSLLWLVAEVLETDLKEAKRWLKKFRVDLDFIYDIERDSKPKQSKNTKPPFGEAYLAPFVDPPKSTLQKRGLSREAADFYEVRWNQQKQSWILPIRYPSGELAGWQEKSKYFFKNYPKKVKKKETLFGIDKLAEDAEYAVLVESPLDVVRLWTVGEENGVSSFGVEVSEQQMRLLLEYVDTIILALDNDPQGRRLTKQLMTTYGRRVRLYGFYYGDSQAKDPGEMKSSEIHRGVDEAWYTVFSSLG